MRAREGTQALLCGIAPTEKHTSITQARCRSQRATQHTPCRLPPLLFLLCRWRPLRVVGARSHYAAPKQAPVGAQEADATVAAQPKVCVWRCNAAPAAATAGKNSLPASKQFPTSSACRFLNVCLDYCAGGGSAA